MVKLANWSIHPVELAYFRPVVWANGVEAGAPLLILRLVADDGSVGAAEVTVKPTWYGVSYKSLIGALEDIFLPLAKQIPDADPEIFADRAEDVPENQIAKALVGNALWDLKAAVKRQPLWKLWGGDSKAAVSALVTRQAPHLMAAEAEELIATYGFRTIKFKGGQGIETDLAALRAVKSAVGDKVGVYVDANWHYPANVAKDYLTTLAGEGVMAVEDPYSLKPDRQFEEIQRGCVPIIVDFFSAGLRDAHLFQERGMRALSLKPGRMGLTECRRQADLGRQTGFDVHVGLAGESAFGSLSALQLAASLPRRHEWLPAEVTFFLMMKEHLVDPIRIKDGMIDLPTEPALAGLLNWDKLQRLAA